MAFCSSCGTQVAGAFCGNCGTAISGSITNVIHDVKSTVQPSNSMEVSNKSWIATTLFAYFLGVFGGHRFYAGKIGSGIAQLFTFGGFTVWWVYDFMMIQTGNFTDVNGNVIISKNSESKTFCKVVATLYGILMILYIIIAVIAVVASSM